MCVEHAYRTNLLTYLDVLDRLKSFMKFVIGFIASSTDWSIRPYQTLEVKKLSTYGSTCHNAGCSCSFMFSVFIVSVNKILL